MEKYRPTPEKVSNEYEAGLQFNNGISFYDCVNVNENFFIGKQWEGVRSNGLPTPVFNFLDRKSTRLNSSHVKRSRMPSSA